MTANFAMVSRTQRFPLRPIFVGGAASVFLVASWILGFGWVVSMAIYLIAAGWLFLTSCSGLLKRSKVTLLSGFCGCALMIVPIAGKTGILHIIDRLDLALFNAFYQKCAQSADQTANGGFAVCWTRDTFSAVDAVVYDSSDQIALPPNARSAEWTKVALKSPVMAAFGVDGFHANLIRGHFYRIYFAM